MASARTLSTEALASENPLSLLAVVKYEQSIRNSSFKRQNNESTPRTRIRQRNGRSIGIPSGGTVQHIKQLKNIYAIGNARYLRHMEIQNLGTISFG